MRLPPGPVESFEQSRVSTGALVGLSEILAPSLERLFTDHGPPVAFHRGVVGGNQLPRDHAFEFVLRRNADQSVDSGALFGESVLRDFFMRRASRILEPAALPTDRVCHAP